MDLLDLMHEWMRNFRKVTPEPLPVIMLPQAAEEVLKAQQGGRITPPEGDKPAPVYMGAGIMYWGKYQGVKVYTCRV